MESNHLSNIPVELTKRRQWVVTDDSKEPFQTDGESKASVSWRGSWTTFKDAQKSSLPHIGFVLTEDDPYVLVDLDVDDDDPKPAEDDPKFLEILKAFKGTYVERSTDGHGIHIICKGTLPRGARKGVVEVYPHGRYMICTGNVLNDKKITYQQEALDHLFEQLAPNDDKEWVVSLNGAATHVSHRDQDIVAKASAAANGAKFDELCAGNTKDYPSQSEADYALLSIIAFYSPDDEQVKRIFRHTVLGRRKKAQRGDYLNRSIRRIRKSKLEDKQVSEAASTVPDGESSIIFESLADIQVRDVDWLWFPWIAKGEIHCVAGDSEVGKTTMLITLAARLSAGKPPFKRPGRVLLICEEGSWEHTQKPIALRAGADERNIRVVRAKRVEDEQVPIALDTDLRAITAGAVRDGGFDLIVIDPVIETGARAKDTYNASQLRLALRPLTEMKKQTGAAILGITHYVKGARKALKAGARPEDLIIGSVAWRQIARFTWFFDEIQDDALNGQSEYTHRFGVKSNIIAAEDRQTLPYFMRKSKGKSGVPELILGAAANEDITRTMQAKEATAKDTAETLLDQHLPPQIEVPVKDIQTAAEHAGISWVTVKRAKATMKIRSVQRAEGWVWIRADYPTSPWEK